MRNAQRSPWPLVLIIGAAVLYYAFQQGGCTAPVTPLVPRPEGPDLVAAFSTNDNRAEAAAHAHAFATLCDELADCIEYDTRQPKPRLTTGVACDDLRRAAREMKFDGASLGSKYPGLPSAVDAFFVERVGTWGGKFDDPKANKKAADWAAAFRQLAKCAEYAAKRG